MVEKIGSGIGRMEDLMIEAQLPKPKYNTQGMFTVIFIRPNKTAVVKQLKTVEETVEETIKKLIKNNPRVTAKEMMDATKLSRRGIEYQINRLKNVGIIERIGSTKGGYWKINKA